MGMPTPAQLLNLDYSYGGQPFLDQSARSNIVLSNMEYSYNGEPFVRNPEAAASPATGNVAVKMVALGMF